MNLVDLAIFCYSYCFYPDLVAVLFILPFTTAAVAVAVDVFDVAILEHDVASVSAKT